MKKQRFEYNDGFDGRFPVPADDVGRELDRIRRLNDEGKLVAEEVWRESKKRGAVLHDCFEWDVNKAAEAQWSTVARQIIRSVRVVVDDDAGNVKDVSFRPYVSVQTGDDYYDVRDVVDDETLNAQYVAKALRDAEAWMLRYRNISELSDVFDAIDRAMKRLLKAK